MLQNVCQSLYGPLIMRHNYLSDTVDRCGSHSPNIQNSLEKIQDQGSCHVTMT